MTGTLINSDSKFDNETIADLLRKVAAAYEIKDEKANKFKITAYTQTAFTIENMALTVKNLWENKKLSTIPGVGKNIAKYLDEFFRTGQVKHFEKLIKNLPKGMFPLIKIKGIGAKTAYKIALELKLKNARNAIFKVKEAAKLGKIRIITGFGDISEKNIYQSILLHEKTREKKKRMTLFHAEILTEEIKKYLAKNKDVKKIDFLGSLRRKSATIKDVDIAVIAKKPKLVIRYFTKFPQVKRVLSSGTKGASVVLMSGYQVDLRVQKENSYGSLLQHYTGSKNHNIKLRELALKKGYSLSEYGVKIVKSSKRLSFKTEREFYRFLGLAWIPPELRENSGEIEAAVKNKLPKLIHPVDIKGDMHIHSDFDVETSHDLGKDSAEIMVEKAASLNYRYLAFAEHNPSQSKHDDSKMLAILKKKREYFNSQKDYWRKKFNVHVFNSLEIDIKGDGSLSIPEKGLDLLDFAICSVHSVFKQPKKEMTARIINALSHPKVKILGHPTGRKIGFREEIEIDWEKLFTFCFKNEKFLEINSWPDRLDLPDYLVKKAIKMGVKMIINSDSHSAEEMDYLKYGIFVARRGWAEKEDIVNTLPLVDICQILKVDC